MTASDPREPQPDSLPPQPKPGSAAFPPLGVSLPGNYNASPPPPPEPRPSGMRRLLLIVASILGGFVACAAIGLVLLFFLTPTLRSRLAFLSPVSGAPPEGPNKFVDPPPGPVNIADDFSGTERRWDRSQTRVAGGAYELTLELDNFDSYGLYLGGSAIRDFDMAVDATFVAGPPNAEYGIRFRQSAPDEHLIFSISPSGFYRLARVSDETYSSLVPWTRDSRIQTGVGATNRLRVVADGATITGFINGQEVLSYSDDQQESGQLTLGLVTFETGGLSVRFDNVEGFAIAVPAGEGTEPLRLELNENFDDAEAALGRWSVGGATINAGAYEVFVGGPVLSWQQPLPVGSSRISGDFSVEVEASLLEGEGGGSGYGIIFGDGGAFDFYALLILPEGGLMLYRNGPDAGMVIPPTPVSNINPGANAPNTIRLEVRDRVMNLLINGEPIEINGVPVTDIPLPDELVTDGMVGVIVQGADTNGIRARFDDFKLEEIQ